MRKELAIAATEYRQVVFTNDAYDLRHPLA